jgi:nucleoside-diphosphate-sugar epimerase
MVVGNGLLARAFSCFRDEEGVVVFASGVSNSLEVDPEPFTRERQLLMRTRAENPEKLFVYFGTCSVDDPERRDTPYVAHKLALEKALATSPGPWLVLRLPLAIGRGQRGPTLAQFLHDRIVRGENFEVWRHASRYPIDVEDAVRIAERFIRDPSLQNRIINVALRAFPVVEFVRCMERILGRKASCSIAEKGARYRISCPEVESVAHELNLDFSDQYLERVLRKYFGTTQ